jgi:hypothetical protein
MITWLSWRLRRPGVGTWKEEDEEKGVDTGLRGEMENKVLFEVSWRIV